MNYLEYLSKLTVNNNTLQILRPDLLIHYDGVFPIFIKNDDTKVLAKVQVKFNSEKKKDNSSTVLLSTHSLVPYTYKKKSKLPKRAFKKRHEFKEIIKQNPFLKEKLIISTKKTKKKKRRRKHR